MYDLIILGGGPAGIAAGIYASRKKINALLITKDFSGQWVTSDKIENFIGFKAISGFELAKAFESHLRAQEDLIDLKDGVLVSSVKKINEGFEISDSNGSVYRAKNILYAIGSGYKKLNVPGEKEYSGKGVFYCSTCDAPLMKNKKVVVVGAGNTGLEAAIDLLPYASEITVLQYNDRIRGDVIYQEKLKSEPKVKIITNAAIKEIFGNDFVTGLKYNDVITNEEKTLDVSGVFVEIGYKPSTDLVKDLVNLNEKGEIIVDHKTFQSSAKGIWAAGDVSDGLYNQFSTAIGDAVNAVLNINETLKNSK